VNGRFASGVAGAVTCEAAHPVVGHNRVCPFVGHV
jgi:hypothetical protein